jgi:hypothetical protein
MGVESGGLFGELFGELDAQMELASRRVRKASLTSFASRYLSGGFMCPIRCSFIPAYRSSAP